MKPWKKLSVASPSTVLSYPIYYEREAANDNVKPVRDDS